MPVGRGPRRYNADQLTEKSSLDGGKIPTLDKEKLNEVVNQK